MRHSTAYMSVAEFVDQYYRADRLHREPGTRGRIIASREQDVRRLGSAIISRHDSTTRDAMTLYDPHHPLEAAVAWYTYNVDPFSEGRAYCFARYVLRHGYESPAAAWWQYRELA